MKEREKHLVEVKMLVSVDALDFDDAKDMIGDVFGAGEIDDLGIVCHSIHIEQYRES